MTETERLALTHLTGESRDQRVAEMVEMKELGYEVKHVGKVRTLYEPPSQFTQPA